MFQEAVFLESILALEMTLRLSHWKYSLESDNGIISGMVHRSEKRNIIDSWELLDEKIKLGLCNETKRKLSEFSSKWKEASGKKKGD